MIKQSHLMSFADIAVEHRTVNTPLFDSVNAIVDWQQILKVITKYYQKGQSIDGRESYNPLILLALI